MPHSNLSPHFPRYGQEWACCPLCSFHYPASRFTFDRKYGWRCWRCTDARPDIDDFKSMVRSRLGEGSRRTRAPRCDPNEGIDTDVDTTDPDSPAPDALGYGLAPYGVSPYGLPVDADDVQGYGQGPFGVESYGGS